jgi:hypothetical protein
MMENTLAQDRHLLLFACDLWLEAGEIHTTDAFKSQVQTMKHDATNAKDERTLRDITDRFLALTGKLAAADWKEYERRCEAADAQKLAGGTESKRRVSKNSRSAALRSF